MYTKKLAAVAVTTFLWCGSLYGTEWVAHFSSIPPESWTGSDATADARYFDTLGVDERHFTVDFNGAASVPAGWLAQGLRGGVPTTAKFFNAPGGINGRARFSTVLPPTMDANGGVSFAWTARYGNYAIGRGPVQLAVTSDGGPGDDATNEFNCYIRVQNGTSLQILNNSGAVISTISALTIPNVADGNFHQWSAAVITSGGVAHWKLWIDGVQQLFGGVDGAHMFDAGNGPEQFSFQTTFNNFDGPSNTPYISLGELNNQDHWDFEFDCFAYRDDGLTPFTCAASAPPCDTSVAPAATQTAEALRRNPATPSSFVYAFTNRGSAPTGYTVEKSDADGNPLPGAYPWLTLDKSGAVSIPPDGTDQVTATIVDTDLAQGTHTAYITFTHTCTPTQQHIRRIDLIITDCEWALVPAGEIARSVTTGSPAPVADAVFTLTNTGVDGLTYTVSKESECAWLTLDRSGGGPLEHGQSDTVTASIDPTGLPPGIHSCTLRFSNTSTGCSVPPPDHVRTVTLHVLGPQTGKQQFVAEFTTFTSSDEAATSPLISCDPSVEIVRDFQVEIGNSLQVEQLDPGWLTQGSIEGTPTTARFLNPPGPAGIGQGVGRARFRAFLPFDDTFDPAKGMAVAWRMRVGNYAPVRGPIQLTFPRVSGPFGTDGEAPPSGDEFNVFIRIQNGTQVSILRNGGAAYAGIGTLVLPESIADEYHQWTASVCYNPADELAYWNLWIDGQKLLFAGSDPDGSAGSPVGPGGATYSFRTPAEDVSGDPYIGLGELNSGTDIWDFEFDWVRMLSYNVEGCPFWDGEGCVPAPLCNTPWADADGDGDVDLLDFAEFQRCFTGSGDPGGIFDPGNCRCFDRNNDDDIDLTDLQLFRNCSTRSHVNWVSTPLCP